ncbi:MAG: BlaI/MecI/CopY family transcriptional regulator [Clostridiales bacterium]|nr:BlaI/MecI/CopY family transcriptional regulator [Clostridiales bacterium]
MNKIKLFEGELKLMELLWSREGATAKELSVLAAENIGWNKNTTYTVIKKLVGKGAIERSEPGFTCRSLVGREEAGHEEAKAVLNSFFGGSLKAMFSSFVTEGAISGEEADELRRMIDDHGKKG